MEIFLFPRKKKKKHCTWRVGLHACMRHLIILPRPNYSGRRLPPDPEGFSDELLPSLRLFLSSREIRLTQILNLGDVHIFIYFERESSLSDFHISETTCDLHIAIVMTKFWSTTYLPYDHVHIDCQRPTLKIWKIIQGQLHENIVNLLCN